MLVIFVVPVFTVNLDPLTIVSLSLSPNPIVWELISVSVQEGIITLGVFVLRVKIPLSLLLLILRVSVFMLVVVPVIFTVLPDTFMVSSVLEPESLE